MRIREAWIGSCRVTNRSFKMITSLPEILSRRQNDSEIDVGGREIRLSFNGVLQDSLSAGRVTMCRQKTSEVVVGLRQVRIENYRLLQRPTRLIQLSGLPVNESEIVQHGRVV